jgi:hypothetical protein
LRFGEVIHLRRRIYALRLVQQAFDGEQLDFRIILETAVNAKAQWAGRGEDRFKLTHPAGEGAREPKSLRLGTFAPLR